MSKSRKNQFGPALTAAFFCLLITGSAVGYVWQKGEIDQLGRQIGQRDALLRQLMINNQKLAGQCADLHEPKMIQQLVKDLNLGMEPSRPEQMVEIVEPSGPVRQPRVERRQWAVRTGSVIP